MFSDTKELGQQTVFQHSAAAEYWSHNALRLHKETAYAGLGSQTGDCSSRLDGGNKMSLTQPEEVRHVLGWKWTGTDYEALDRQRRLRLSTERQCAPPVCSGRGSLKEPNFRRWTHFPEAGLRCSMSVKESCRQCECVRQQNAAALHPFRRKFVLPPTALFVGQGHCREPKYVAEKQVWGDTRAKCKRDVFEAQPECEATDFSHRCRGSDSAFSHGQEHAENHHDLGGVTGPKTHQEKVSSKEPKLGPALICSTKACQRHLGYGGLHSPCLPGNGTKFVQSKAAGETQIRRGALWTRSQASVRDRIRQVVSDLEGVLGGLKQVHLEMKEVVQQIELLTSNIDLKEEEPSNCLPSNTSSRNVTVSSQKKVINLELNTNPAPVSLTHTIHTTPPAINPSVIINQAVLPSPSKAPHKHMSAVSPEENPQLVILHRDEKQELQRWGDGLGPVSPLPMSQNQQEEGRLVLPRTVSGKQRPPVCPHNGTLEGKSAEAHPPGVPPHPVKRRQLSTTV
ncbi:uncharacterized protein LOC125709049 [Brienomyrus brachyistius]|uniref:uncharacterized protein LOC125709049 n=1 Tax=Brienomyrus brachyistius TaxID=42636 RepID=UPI0020B3FD7F|nr:uncharacterized protein LOC125709049 [Brienomyrus brachyistius]